MTCTETRVLLPLHAYGDLSPAERANVETHLAECAACRVEAAALTCVRRGLDAMPPPAIAVDLAQLYRRETDRQRRVTRRWRVAALVGVAASVLVLVSRVDVRMGKAQLVVRWGAPDSLAAVTTIVERTTPVGPSEVDERLEVMAKLIHALARNVKTGDQERDEELARLQSEFAEFRQQSQQHWKETQRDVKGLYTAQFGPRQ